MGFTAGLKGAEERIQNLRQAGAVDENQAIVSVEGFIIEMLPDRYNSCLFVCDIGLCVRKPTFWVPTRSDTNQAVKSQKMGRGWKFWI